MAKQCAPESSSRAWKLNTYGLTWDQMRYLAQAFRDIAEKYGINVAG